METTETTAYNEAEEYVIHSGSNGRNRVFRPIWSPFTTHEWWEDGACYEQDPNLFEVQEGLTVARQMDDIVKGLAFCNDCSVKETCLSKSTEADRFWTTRGGQPPERLVKKETFTTPRSKPVKEKNSHQRGVKCQRGHDDWAFKKAEGSYTCRVCRNSNEKARAAAKLSS